MMTYTEWRAQQPEPADELEAVKQYCLAHGRKKFNPGTKLFTVGTVYKDRKIVDLRILKNRGNMIAYKLECQKCGNVYWIRSSSFDRMTSKYCPKCSPWRWHSIHTGPKDHL